MYGQPVKIAIDAAQPKNNIAKLLKNSINHFVLSIAWFLRVKLVELVVKFCNVKSLDMALRLNIIL